MTIIDHQTHPHHQVEAEAVATVTVTVTRPTMALQRN